MYQQQHPRGRTALFTTHRTAHVEASLLKVQVAFFGRHPTLTPTPTIRRTLGRTSMPEGVREPWNLSQPRTPKHNHFLPTHMHAALSHTKGWKVASAVSEGIRNILNPREHRIHRGAQHQWVQKMNVYSRDVGGISYTPTQTTATRGKRAAAQPRWLSAVENPSARKMSAINKTVLMRLLSH